MLINFLFQEVLLKTIIKRHKSTKWKVMKFLKFVIINFLRLIKKKRLRSLRSFSKRRITIHNNERLLGGIPQNDMDMILSAKTGGATPLLIACRNGHFDVVQYLLKKCRANVELTGSVIFDGETIEGAPPLWCAAAAGHAGIVRLLVDYNANVNSTTKTNSTPLRAACFDGHFEIVKYLVSHGADIEMANRHGHTCLMIACYKGHYRIAQYLLSLNADVNRRSVKGNTALHDCAESGSLEILQLLLEHGATMDVDSYGMTPLLAASVTGHIAIVEHLIKLPSVKRIDKIAALELLGATYVDKKRDMLGALSFWRRAMEDRYNNYPVLAKQQIQKEPVPAYDYAQEVCDLNALDELVMDPDEMRMQALLIRERILGPVHPDTSYYIRFRGAVYADSGRFDRCIELWTYALTMQQNILEPLNPMTQSSLLSFAELFSFMLGEAGRPITRGRIVPPIETNDMLLVFKKSVTEVELGQEMIAHLPESEKDSTALNRALVIALHLACLLVRPLDEEDCSEEIKEDIYKAFYELISLKVIVRSGRTPLHLACYREAALVGRYPTCQLPSSKLAKALLHVGADPNAKDEAGNTPLHLAALARPCPADLAQTLLESGAHLDTKNMDGDTFRTLLQNQNIHELVNPIKFTSLACLAARTISKHRINFHNEVPSFLYDFIESH